MDRKRYVSATLLLQLKRLPFFSINVHNRPALLIFTAPFSLHNWYSWCVVVQPPLEFAAHRLRLVKSVYGCATDLNLRIFQIWALKMEGAARHGRDVICFYSAFHFMVKSTYTWAPFASTCNHRQFCHVQFDRSNRCVSVKRKFWFHKVASSLICLLLVHVLSVLLLLFKVLVVSGNSFQISSNILCDTKK